MSKISGGTATAAKARKKPRGKPFTKNDSRSWRHGCKSKAQLNFELEAGKLFAKVGAETIEVTNRAGRKFKTTNLEAVVRVVFSQALGGDIAAEKEVLDRTLGKATQPISGGLDLNVSLSMETLLKSYKEYKRAGA